MICGKIIFKSRTEAATALKGTNGKNANKRNNRDRLGITYYCDDCKGWHLSSKERKRKARKHSTEQLDLAAKEKLKQKVKSTDGFLRIANFTGRKL